MLLAALMLSGLASGSQAAAREESTVPVALVSMHDELAYKGNLYIEFENSVCHTVAEWVRAAPSGLKALKVHCCETFPSYHPLTIPTSLAHPCSLEHF